METKIMPKKTKYTIDLSKEERDKLETMIKGGKHSARKLNRVRILLYRDISKGKKIKSQRWITEILQFVRSEISKCIF